MIELTAKEEAAITKLEKAISNLPDTLIKYVLDDTMYICKRGVSCNDIGVAVGHWFYATNMLTDLHDDMDMGRDK